MRIRNRFPSFPVIPSSVTSSKEPSQLEEMEVSSFLASAEGTARESPEKVHSDWQSITAEAHRLLGCSSYTSNYCTIRPHVQEEHSSTNPVSNGETVIEQGGGNAGKQIFDLFSNSQMKGNCSGTAMSNTKRTTVSSSLSKGDAKVISSGKSIDRKAETAKRVGGWKERTNDLCSTEAGSSRHACANGSHGLKCKGKAEDEEHYSSSSSVKKKAKTRSITSIYDDIRSLIPISP